MTPRAAHDLLFLVNIEDEHRAVIAARTQQGLVLWVPVQRGNTRFRV